MQRKRQLTEIDVTKTVELLKASNFSDTISRNIEILQ
jgi:hypothetical protein